MTGSVPRQRRRPGSSPANRCGGALTHGRGHAYETAACTHPCLPPIFLLPHPGQAQGVGMESVPLSVSEQTGCWGSSRCHVIAIIDDLHGSHHPRTERRENTSSCELSVPRIHPTVICRAPGRRYQTRQRHHPGDHAASMGSDLPSEPLRRRSPCRGVLWISEHLLNASRTADLLTKVHPMASIAAPQPRRAAPGARSRVELLDARRAPLLARPFFEGGDPGAIAATIAHVPEVLDATMPFLAQMFGPSALPARTKELVILRTSALLDCRYCIQSHSIAARDAGLARDEVLALRGDGPLSNQFTDGAERALLDWVDAVAGSTGPVSPEIGDALMSHFAEPDVIELTLLAGTTMMLNRFCTALGLPTSPAALARLAEDCLL